MAEMKPEPLPVIPEEDDARQLLRRGRKLPEAEMDITPMIDITFLLLIFFLVASRLDSSGAVQLPVARYGEPVPSKNAVVVTIDREGEGAAVYKGDGTAPDTKLEAVDLLDQENEIADYITEQLTGGAAKEHVLIKAAKGVKHRDVSRVLAAVGKAGRVEVVYIAVLETQ